MTAQSDTHTRRCEVEFLTAERYVSNNHTRNMDLKRHARVNGPVCVWLCSACVHCSQGYFVHPIALLGQTVHGAGSDKIPRP